MSLKAFHVLLSAVAAVALAFPQADAGVIVRGDTNPGNRNVVHPGRYLPGGNMPVSRRPMPQPRHIQPPQPRYIQPLPAPRHRDMRRPLPPPPPRPKVKGPERYTPEGYLKPSTKAPHRVQDGPLQPRR